MAQKDVSAERVPVFRSQSVVDNVLEWIVDQIISGQLKPGDKLPTEVELCRDLGVGRNSVREAIKKLEAYGVIYIKRAEGTFIAQEYSQKMLDPMLYGMILQNDDWKSFIELRRALDIGLLYVVVRQEKSLEDLAALHRSLAHLEEETADVNATVEEIHDADCQFHQTLAQISHNPLLVTVSDYINRITVPSRLETTRFILEEGQREKYIRLHQQLVHIVESSDNTKIEKTVNEHYMFWTRKKEDSPTAQ